METNFNQSELNVLCNALINELYRWNDFCLCPNTTERAKSNYQEDMIYLDKLIFETKCYISEESEANILLHSTDMGFIIEAIDNEIEMHQSNFTLEIDQILKNLRVRLKNETLTILGDRFLKIAHYDRNLKQ